MVMMDAYCRAMSEVSVVAGHGNSTFAMHLTMVFDGLTPTKPGHKALIYTTFSSTNSLIHGVRLPRFEATDT